MNQRPVFPARHQQEPRDEEAPELDLDGLIAIVRRQWRVVGLCVAVSVALGIGYLLTAVPRYTARTSVLIDRGNRQVVEQLSTIGGVMDDEASVLSQVELLRSETIGLSAVDRLETAGRSTIHGRPPQPYARGGFRFAVDAPYRAMAARG